jgi:hypothetical protein
MSVGQLTNDDLVANKVRFDPKAHNEPAINTTAATVALSHEIEIDESHRVLNSPASRGGYAFYVALIIGLLAATCGFGGRIDWKSLRFFASKPRSQCNLGSDARYSQRGSP